MNCPVCPSELTPVEVGDVTVDACLGGCGGIWFDLFELQKLDEPHDVAGQMLINVKRPDHVQIDHSKRRLCPRCPDVVMMRHFYSPRRRVEVDECPSCGGFWLDAGELALIREEHEDVQKQEAAITEQLDAATVSILGPLRSAGTEHSARVRRIEQLFRFTRSFRYAQD